MDTSRFNFSAISNLSYIETLYQSYLQGPSSIDISWQHFFEGMRFAEHVFGQTPLPSTDSPDLKVHLLIEAFRSYGHLSARCNPIETAISFEPAELSLERYGFKIEELDTTFPTCGFLDSAHASLKDIIEALKKTYCGTVGIEYVGLGEPSLEKWLQQHIEPFFPLELSREDKLWIFELLSKAELFESFLHTKYVGQKRFSLEGGDTLIPMLTALIEKGAELGLTDAILGMAHRGRLNVLVNILNKSFAQIFREFEAHYTPDEFEGTGDVKYHKGFTGKLQTRLGKTVDLILVANPSHLEAVDPVVEGIVRAKQELKGDKQHRRECIPILIHGDASISGQGVIYETIQLSRLNGYATGGTLHIVINNQIGFTTLPKDGRSTRYCTEIGRSFGCPVFHVNAEDPEGCVRVARLAIEMRQRFQCDVFIDLNCYRKYGHNESDEPTFTQPLEYAIIKGKRSIRQIYKEKLIQDGILEESKAVSLENTFKEYLHHTLENSPSPSKKTVTDAEIPKETSLSTVATRVDASKLIALCENFCTVPVDLKIHPKVAQGLKARLDMVHAKPGEPHIDWGLGEHLAYASLLIEGIHVRLSGQDVRRGTFSHRHAIWVDQVRDLRYFPLAHLDTKQAPFDIFNSPLSEYAVMGFEFGYSISYPHSLVIWEAQFGDFANGAQIIIDQFIASSEQKWHLNSNLTLFLPHGYEGQGPEHSSGRIERFLQLTGHENMRIVNCSTPAQLFHLLRAQAVCPVKKPLIVFTPKAALRYPHCVSSMNDFSQGSFQEIIDDLNASPTSKRLFFCSGKIYYDLIEAQAKAQAQAHAPFNRESAIVRIEQLFPFPKEHMRRILGKYASVGEVYWIQEEHRNMGAWEYLRPLFDELLGTKAKLEYIGRDRSASPAAGSYALHKKQWEEIIQRAFG